MDWCDSGGVVVIRLKLWSLCASQCRESVHEATAEITLIENGWLLSQNFECQQYTDERGGRVSENPENRAHTHYVQTWICGFLGATDNIPELFCYFWCRGGVSTLGAFRATQDSCYEKSCTQIWVHFCMESKTEPLLLYCFIIFVCLNHEILDMLEADVIMTPENTEVVGW